VRTEIAEKAESTVRAELVEERRRREEAERERENLRRELEALREARESPENKAGPPVPVLHLGRDTGRAQSLKSS
jgi:hypothetical protein